MTLFGDRVIAAVVKMMSCRSRAGPSSNITDVPTRTKKTHREKAMCCNEEARKECQGFQTAARTRETGTEQIPLTPSEEPDLP